MGAVDLARRTTRELNRAYAFVMSKEFGSAAKELTEELKMKGFSEVEAFKAVQENLPETGGMGDLFSVPSDVVNHGMTCEQMVLVRFQIKQRLEWHLNEALGKARRKAYRQTFCLGGDYKLALDLPEGFALDEHVYAGNADVYRGSWRFKKHYLGTYAIPKFDGKKPFGEGEEFECAKLIDSSPKVLYWLRNKDSDPASFRLPMVGKTEWFYPDFIGELVDGRLFVIEYKGELTGQTADTVEKTAIGKLWAGQDPSRYVYATIYGAAPSGIAVAQQIDDTFKD